MQNHNSKFKIFLLLLAVSFLAVSCNSGSTAQAPAAPAPTLTATPTPANMVSSPRVFSYSGVAGTDAMTLLKNIYKVETKDFGKGLGEFVQSIEGVSPAKDEFWGFYVNGKISNVGASQYKTKNGDLVEWKLNKIESYNSK